MAMSDLNESHLALARITDALFCSDLKVGATLTKCQVAQAIRDALRVHRDWNGLTRAVRSAFAKAPAAATRREEWCRLIAEDLLRHGDVVLGSDALPG